MTPYYEADGIMIYHGDCRDIVPSFRSATVISDPPYNVGYHYGRYTDSLSTEEYDDLLGSMFRPSSVILHYPMAIFRLARRLRRDPERCIAWVYHANTPYQWRMLAWFGCAPDLSLVKQPYKNPTDRRVAQLIADGSMGTSLYDWWHIEQVKNVSDEKTDHPCQIPTLLMDRAISVTPCETVLDPFMGSGTTLVAAKRLGRKAIGIDMDESYCEIAARRLSQGVLSL